MFKKFILTASILVALISATVALQTKIAPTPSSHITVALVGAPYSADPIDYDAFIHHIAFRSVYLSIVSQYQLGRYTGVLADQWHSDDRFQKWVFHIRKEARFENGDAITPEMIVRSWTRLAYLMKTKGSHSSFFDHLQGIALLESPTSQISGLTADSAQNIVTIQLDTPQKNLLDTLSFGLYGVVHPGDYDPITGKWRDPHKVIASGPYKLTKWTDTTLRIERRADYPLEIGHAKPFSAISFSWAPEQRADANLVMGNSIDTDVRKSHAFVGGANSAIAYARCRSWQLPDSPCHDRSTRIALRDAYYAELEKMGYPVTRSFFPLAIKGVKELPATDLPPHLAGQTTVSSPGRPVKFAHTKMPNPLFIAFNAAAPLAIAHAGFTPVKAELPFATFIKEYDQGLSSYAADMYMLATGILIEDPMHDVQFMFFSQEGIRLPDADGSIHAELKNQNPDIQKINQLLWDQAIIWPITHYASGFWSTNEIDFSLINTVLPPTDFQWLGLK